MVESKPEILSISNQVEFEMKVLLYDLDNPGHQVIVVIDQVEEDVIRIREIQERLRPRLGPIQIVETFPGRVYPEENLGYYKNDVLYYRVLHQVTAKFERNFDFEPFFYCLEDFIDGPLLFKEIAEKIKLEPQTFFLYIQHEMHREPISRNNTSVEWSHKKGAVLYISMLRGGKTQICVILTKTTKVPVCIGEETTAAELKELIDINYKVPSDAMKLTLGSDILDDDKCLRDAGVVENSEVRCYRTNRAMIERMSLTFVDLSSHQGDTTIPFVKAAKEWEVVKPGLCVEGKCENKDCDAYGYSVIVNKRFGVTHAVLDRPKHLCPMCDKIVKFERFAFNNCIYELHGEIFKDSELLPTTPVPKSVGNEYFRYDSKEEWGRLKIVTKKSTDTVDRCIACKRPAESEFIKFKCKHNIHETCRKFVKDCFICNPIK